MKFGVNSVVSGNLTGTIKNTAAAPVANTLVSIQGTDLKAFSNAQGVYQFPYLMPGVQTVTYSAFSYVVASYDLNIAVGTIKNVVLENLPKATITGTIHDNDNLPVAGANIQITGYAPFSGITNASGVFSIAGVYFDPSYTVTVSKNGYQTK